MNDIVRKVSDTLGPDTAMLQLRVGLHSGPVTAGVLRGQKSRFQLVSAKQTLILVPLFVFTFGRALGGNYEEDLAYYSRPFPAIVMGLTLVVVVPHLLREAQEAIEDYVHGVAEKLALMAARAFAYTLIAAGLFALARLALGYAQ